MQFTQESKSQLAKLMASENIRVEHRKIQTAMFDLKSRTLYCPIWENMSGELYDLLLGHEVGHALETPEEGWHNAVMGTGKFNKNFKHFLNVVEDARIEKKIKRRYPGLRPSFIKAYRSLMEKNFFGVNNTDINKLPFIDRLNLYTKGGSGQGIVFNDEEQSLVSEVESCETWEDVVRVTGAIFDYSKDEQKQMMEEKMKQISSSFDNMDESDFQDDYGLDDSEDDDGFGDSEDDYGDYDEYEESEESGSKSEQKPSENSDESSDEEQYVLNRFKDSSPFSGFKDREPVCITDEAFRNNESKLLSKDNREYLYVNVPTPFQNKIVTPYKRVHELMESFWNDCEYVYPKVQELYTEFKNKNDRYIGLLAKEFEMRKSASKFSKQKISETGDIDVNRIYKYQIEDNLFRKLTKIPKGKSHGLVIMFDRSGSMTNCMKPALEQVLILTAFCRKVNIPFVVYGFGNNDYSRSVDFPNENPFESFSHNDKELKLSRVYLREYLNSNMKASEYTKCVKNILALSNSYRNGYSRLFPSPNSEQLSNTPLIESMVALEPLTNSFRKNYNLDIVNTVLIHDGDTDRTDYYNNNNLYKSFNFKTQNVVLTDKKNKLQFDVEEDKLFENILEWYTKVTDSKIIGFYITGNSYETREAIRRRYHDVNGKSMDVIYPNNYSGMMQKAKELQKTVREKKFLESNNKGYSKFYFVPGDANLSAEDYELNIEQGAKNSQIKKAFLKANVRKQISRVFVNKFIQQIAV